MIGRVGNIFYYFILYKVKEGKNVFFDLERKAISSSLTSVIYCLDRFFSKVCLTQILQHGVESFLVG